MAKTRASRGFTLIEIIIALAIVAVTTTIAVASFRGHLRRGHRAEAAQALLLAAAEQEKFHLSHGSYADRLDARVGDAAPGLPVASRTPGGHYALAITHANAAEFRIAATATGERSDALCRTLYIDESGRRSASDSRGADSTAKCW
jgi:type IV pilus assembly protein PilE